jgi:hypothetical protein
MKPHHPAIMLPLARILMNELGLPAEASVTFAYRLIDALREREMDIVKDNWMENPTREMPKISWDDIAALADESEVERGFKPWAPPELA